MPGEVRGDVVRVVGGEALVRTPDNTALRDVVLDSIQSIPGVRSTRTWLVFEEDQGKGVRWDTPST
ncbi:Lrp/AsnC ligand binding domain-containing protein [Streptomyces sp. NBC_01506]|uniref:Lrp/AsnC ligand binding domain-containing protein n=1 Tax=Streptomyces sp. NBC_01506 TaxID=2903887 RepID=UPI00386A10E2